jgi:hypothetical protein
MVVASLTIGALVGIVLSGGFVYWEVGRFAEPQVPVTLFDERREMFAYTAGLFVGVPLAVAFVLFRLEVAVGALIGGLVLLVGLVAGTEVAQLLLVRSRFWAGEARPFYALGFRAGIGGILALAIVASYFTGPVVIGLGLAAMAVTSVAVIALEVAGALLSLRTAPSSRVRGGGPWSGAVVGVVGFLLLGLGPIAGDASALAAAIVLLLGATVVYFRLRPLLDRVAPPSRETVRSPPAAPPAYGRTERPLPEDPSPGQRR